MNKIGSYILVTGLLIFIFLMPMWIALAIRLVFRKTTRRRILAALTALPFTVWFYIKSLNRGRFLPDLEWDEYGITFRIMVTGLIVFLSTLVNFGIPYLMTKAGIAIGDKIMKKPTKWIEVKTNTSATN